VVGTHASFGERNDVASLGPDVGEPCEVGEGLREELGELAGDPDTTKQLPVRTAALGGTEGSCNRTGWVYVSTLP
jgi:hypothetical protein